MTKPNLTLNPNMTKYCNFLFLLCIICCAATSVKADLIYSSSPEGAREVVRSTIQNDLLGGAGLLGRIPEEQVTTLDPLRVYGLDLITNFDSEFLSKAEFECWLYPLLHGTNSVGACEVSLRDLPPKKPDTSILYKTGGSRETLAALKVAATLSQVKDHDYEVRRISFIFVSFTAIWLHGESDDIIIPLPRDYPDTTRYFTAYKIYSEPQMAEILRNMEHDEKMRSR